MLRLDNWHPIVCTGQNITGKNTMWLGCLWVLVGTSSFLARGGKYSNSITTSSLMAIFCLNVEIEGILHVSFIFSNIWKYIFFSKVKQEDCNSYYNSCHRFCLGIRGCSVQRSVIKTMHFVICPDSVLYICLTQVNLSQLFVVV